MQQSNAVRKLEENFPTEAPQIKKREPQFGDRPNPQVKPVQKVVPSVTTQVTHEHIIRIQAPTDLLNDGESQLAVPSLSLFEGYKKQKKALVPTILNDIFSNLLTYVLILVVTTLAVLKVHQVQMTRDMTIQYNEVIRHNELLDKEWLTLLSDREALTEYSVIRKNADEKLGMVQPKTEDEVVIDLR